MADDETHIGRNNEERKEDENRRIMGAASAGRGIELIAEPSRDEWAWPTHSAIVEPLLLGPVPL